ncbi:MAG: tRNA preQ1(34) S-adenosylmethionine ribosyltransferase-isomerase QueA [bacterium]
MKLTDFDFSLPEELIAQQPARERTDSRLLVLNGQDGSLKDQGFTDLLELVEPNDLLILNNTRVIPARLQGQKETGGQVEVLVERVQDEHHVRALIRSSKSPKPGALLIVAGKQFKVISRDGSLYHLEYCETESVFELLDSEGHMPLPPYITRQDNSADRERYQTVFGYQKGSSAAPTAGLHFDLELLDKIRAKGVQFGEVTLHVGLGTFEPVRVDDLSQHVMHAEQIEVSQQLVEQIKDTQQKGGRIIAIGTTAVRAIESAAAEGKLKAYKGETRLFLTPGSPFRVIDAMVTNFHLPQSTLLMLVCAFAGQKQVLNAYAHAVKQHYRFFSYGDAMFITRNTNTPRS